jgi:hypothetical protein
MTPISSAGHLSRAVNIEDLRELARRRLPRIVFNYIDGGADGEWTLRENRRAFDAITFRPHQAVAVRAVISEPACWVRSCRCRYSWETWPAIMVPATMRSGLTTGLGKKKLTPSTFSGGARGPVVPLEFSTM